jgi:drug/metabolite transporter (DMT)-like permease
MATKPPRRNDITLAAAGVVLGVAAAVAYATFRAINDSAASTSDRWSNFGEQMLFPGLLVIAAVTAMVWLGWKANIDG